jgi:hypothetical protein
MEDAERTTRPATIGELRQRLRSLGEPWTVSARFSDDDPLPDLTRFSPRAGASWAQGAPATQVEVVPLARVTRAVA